MGKVEDVTERLNNMGTMVRDIVSSMELVAGYGGTRCCGKKSHDDVRLRSI